MTAHIFSCSGLYRQGVHILQILTSLHPARSAPLPFIFLTRYLPGLASQVKVKSSKVSKGKLWERARLTSPGGARAAQEAAVRTASPPLSKGHLAAWRCPGLPRTRPDVRRARLPPAPPPPRPPRRRSLAPARRGQPTSPWPVPVRAAAGLLQPGCSRQPCGTLRPGAARRSRWPPGSRRPESRTRAGTTLPRRRSRSCARALGRRRSLGLARLRGGGRRSARSSAARLPRPPLAPLPPGEPAERSRGTRPTRPRGGAVGARGPAALTSAGPGTPETPTPAAPFQVTWAFAGRLGLGLRICLAEPGARRPLGVGAGVGSAYLNESKS